MSERDETTRPQQFRRDIRRDMLEKAPSERSPLSIEFPNGSSVALALLTRAELDALTRQIAEKDAKLADMTAQRDNWYRNAGEMLKAAGGLSYDGQRGYVSEALDAAESKLADQSAALARLEQERDMWSEEAHAWRDIKQVKAFSSDFQRMWDLVRHQRHALLDAELITREEYAALLLEETADKRNQGSPSPRRLESYDEMRANVAEQIADLRRLLGEQGGTMADLHRDLAAREREIDALKAELAKVFAGEKAGGISLEGNKGDCSASHTCATCKHFSREMSCSDPA